MGVMLLCQSSVDITLLCGLWVQQQSITQQRLDGPPILPSTTQLRREGGLSIVIPLVFSLSYNKKKYIKKKEKEENSRWGEIEPVLTS
jgi:hypothetical protein